MKTLSLSQAAKEVGKSKPTISNAIKTGRLSATKIKNGYEIDPAELFRVYPRKPETEPQNLSTVEPSNETKVALLELELRMVKEQLEREREIAQDYKAQFDKANNLLIGNRKSVWKRITGG